MDGWSCRPPTRRHRRRRRRRTLVVAASRQQQKQLTTTMTMVKAKSRQDIASGPSRDVISRVTIVSLSLSFSRPVCAVL